jgi:polar amino acid transport system permease protein
MTTLPVLLRVAPLPHGGPLLSRAALPAAAAIGLLLSCAYAQAASGAADPSVLAALLRWAPIIIGGVLLNIGISILAMVLGTVLGLPLGLLLLARNPAARAPAWTVMQFFRNTPWLVLLFYVMFLTPYQIQIGGLTILLPAWIKAVIGLALPVGANVAEIVRGGVQSIPGTQWSAADSLGFGKLQTLRMVILPQALRRMLPPWVNLHAVLTMASSLISVVGIQDGLALTKAAVSAEGRPELLVPMYLLLLLLFFAYCYPVARLTLVLENRLQRGIA